MKLLKTALATVLCMSTFAVLDSSESNAQLFRRFRNPCCQRRCVTRPVCCCRVTSDPGCGSCNVKKKDGVYYPGVCSGGQNSTNCYCSAPRLGTGTGGTEVLGNCKKIPIVPTDITDVGFFVDLYINTISMTPFGKFYINRGPFSTVYSIKAKSDSFVIADEELRWRVVANYDVDEDANRPFAVQNNAPTTPVAKLDITTHKNTAGAPISFEVNVERSISFGKWDVNIKLTPER